MEQTILCYKELIKNDSEFVGPKSDADREEVSKHIALI